MPMLLVVLVLGGAACDDANPTAPSRVTPASAPLLSAQSSRVSSSSSSAMSSSMSRASAPTRALMSGSAPSDQATVTGLVNGGAAVRQGFLTMTSTMTVTGTAPGFTATTAVDKLGRFTLSGVPIGDLQIQFIEPPTVDAWIQIPGIGPGETIDLAVTVVGTTATIETLHRTGGGDLIELDGRIAELDLVARTLNVAGTSVFVPNGTLIVDAGLALSLDALSIGDTVLVSGTSDGFAIEANRIERVAQVVQVPVTVEGPLLSLSGSCPSLAFIVDGTAVSTSGATFFDDIPCIDQQNFLSVAVTGHLVDDVLEALVVNVETVILDGFVSMVTAPCPTAAFMADGTQVSTDLATRFVDGSCADIGDGVRVHVMGVVAVGGVRALEVRLHDPVVSVRGNILGLTGACPALSFAISDTPVATSATTTFTGGACADLLEGVPVEAKGRLLADTLRAESITIEIGKTGQTQSSSIEGVLDSVGGQPPNLVLLVDGVSVRTSADTRVMRRGGTQALVDLVAGQRVHVVGDRFPDGVIAARKIQIKADAASGPVVLDGKVSGIRGDCPAVTFVINGVQIVTNVLTTFDGSPCATLQNGQRVTLSGLAQADGTVAAGTLDAEPSKRNDGDSDDDEENEDGEGDEILNGNGNGKGKGKGKKQRALGHISAWALVSQQKATQLAPQGYGPGENVNEQPST